jgi:hypothetical protein
MEPAEKGWAQMRRLKRFWDIAYKEWAKQVIYSTVIIAVHLVIISDAVWFSLCIVPAVEPGAWLLDMHLWLAANATPIGVLVIGALIEPVRTAGNSLSNQWERAGREKKPSQEETLLRASEKQAEDNLLIPHMTDKRAI